MGEAEHRLKSVRAWNKLFFRVFLNVCLATTGVILMQRYIDQYKLLPIETSEPEGIISFQSVAILMRL